MPGCPHTKGQTQGTQIFGGPYLLLLTQLRPIARSLTARAAKTILHAFVACRLDYCNSLLHGITDSLFRRLQSIHNGPA